MGREPRIVITGVGSVSALGLGGGDHVAGALAASVPRLRPIQAFSTAACDSHLGGEVGELGAYLSADEARRLTRVSQLALVAGRLAVQDAGLEPGALGDLGLVLGSEYGDFRSSEEFARGYLNRGPLGLSPMVFPHTVMNAMAAQAAIALGVRGAMLTINQSGIAGELAVARAARLIAAGRATAVLAGGVDELCPILYHELVRLKTTSPRGAGPEGCWPFDRRANGTVAGEGATVLCLEVLDRAAARGARVYAELAAAAWGNLPSPSHGFPVRRERDPALLRRVFAAAGVGLEAVDAVYLSGTGHPAQDACELDLVEALFRASGRDVPALTALTPLAGEHAGLGALRVGGAAVATLAGGRLPVLPDLAEPVRPGLAFATGAHARRLSAGHVLVQGLARGGGHVALLLRHARDGVPRRAAA